MIAYLFFLFLKADDDLARPEIIRTRMGSVVIRSGG